MGEEKVKKQQPSLISDFKVFVRRFGEDKPLGGAVQTKGEAKKVLFSKLRTTLAASGYITQSGKKVKVNELELLGTGFATSKKDIFRVIEIKSKRLKKGSFETEEIKMFKKSGKGGKRRRNLFGI